MDTSKDWMLLGDNGSSPATQRQSTSEGEESIEERVVAEENVFDIKNALPPPLSPVPEALKEVQPAPSEAYVEMQDMDQG